MSGFSPVLDSLGPFDQWAPGALRGWGVEPVPVNLPPEFPLGAIRIVLNLESALAAVDELTRSGRDNPLVRQDAGVWPISFRSARMIPAVESLQAYRVGTLVMGALDAALEEIGGFITASKGGRSPSIDESDRPPSGGSSFRIRGRGSPRHYLARRSALGGGRCSEGDPSLAGRNGSPHATTSAFRGPGAPSRISLGL